jgi:multidrug efflux pump subunit AcrA (membrane-fusion protein)
MKKYFVIYAGAAVFILSTSCQSKEQQAAPAEDMPEVITPVTITTISSGAMETFVELNATSVFQQKWIIRSNVTGYLQKSTIRLNKLVSTGQVLYTIKTKEAESIGNTISKLDSSFKFSGVNSVRSNGTGFISEINRQEGDYVQDGEQLAVVTDTKSFVFLLDLPYEMRPYIAGKNSLELLLPDGEKMQAAVGGNMPVMDSASQTQRIILRVNTTHPVPENLIAKVRLVKNQNNHASYLPKAAILADEAQLNFWVMKMIDDSTAAKVEIKKGIETVDKVEIISPVFSLQDKILITGNFGLADTAKVKIISSAAENQ